MGMRGIWINARGEAMRGQYLPDYEVKSPTAIGNNTEKIS